MSNPVFIVLGAALAALIAGFFSYVNLVSLKENKVSEFRLAWIDGLREEVAAYTAAVQDLARMERARLEWPDDAYGDDSLEEVEMRWFDATRDSYLAVVTTLAKIQLRLNPRHIQERPDGPEARLMSALEEAREAFNDARFEEAMEASAKIRVAAAPLLKSTWDDVKNGEPRYQRVRETARQVITAGVGVLGTIAIIALVATAVNQR